MMFDLNLSKLFFSPVLTNFLIENLSTYIEGFNDYNDSDIVTCIMLLVLNRRVFSFWHKKYESIESIRSRVTQDICTISANDKSRENCSFVRLFVYGAHK